MTCLRNLTAQLMLGVFALNAMPPLSYGNSEAGHGAKPPAAKKAGLLHRELRLHYTSGGKNVITFGVSVGEKPAAESKSRKETAAPATPSKSSRLKPFLINGLIASLVWFGAEVKKHPVVITTVDSHLVVKMPGLNLDLDNDTSEEKVAPPHPKGAPKSEDVKIIPRGFPPDLRVQPRIPKTKIPGSQFESEPSGGSAPSAYDLPMEQPVYGATPVVETVPEKRINASDSKLVLPAIQFLIENARKPGLTIEVASNRGPITITDPIAVRKHLVKEVEWLRKTIAELHMNIPIADAQVTALNSAISDLGFKADSSSGFLELSETATRP